MFFLFLFCSVTDADDSAGAAPVTVRTGIEKETIYIGDKVTYYIEVETGKDVEISLPGFGENLSEFSIKDFGSKEGGYFGKKKLKQWYILDTYETGTFTIPAIVVKYRSRGEDEWKEILSDSVKIEVLSSLDETALEGDIKDIKGPVSYWDKKYIIILLSIVIVIALILFIIIFLQKRRKTKEVRIPAVPAHELAYKALQSLMAKDYLSIGKVQEYYVELSNIMRHYIENRFQLKAPEMTTEEFLLTLRESVVLNPEQKSLVRDFLSHCDMVKFAKYLPAKNEIDASYESAKNLVDQTKETLMQGADR
jgi:hypothetical protein